MNFRVQARSENSGSWETEDGNDVGYHTRVDIDFNNIRVQLKETGNCVSSTTIRMLEMQGAISKSLNKGKAMKTMEFIAPQELKPVNR